MKSAVLLWHLESLGSKRGSRTMGSDVFSGVPIMRRGWATACALPLLALGLMAAQAGWSQEPKPSGSSSTAQQKVAVAVLTGHVTGAGGAPIADAEVAVEDLVSHQKFSAKTDSGGGFTITNLPAGEISLTVSKAGFKRFLVNKMPLVGGDQAKANVQMQPGSPNEVVIGKPTSVVSRAGTALAGKDLNDIPQSGLQRASRRAARFLLGVFGRPTGGDQQRADRQHRQQRPCQQPDRRAPFGRPHQRDADLSQRLSPKPGPRGRRRG
jgi:hypothetical protein